MGRCLPDGIDRALLYCPAADPEVEQLLVAAVRQRVVRLVTSSAADPAGDATTRMWTAGDDREVVLLLGWTDAETGHSGSAKGTVRTRWHTPQEISAAAITVLDGAPGRTLGRVRPWSERPQ